MGKSGDSPYNFVMNTAKKIILLTGATRGLGRALVPRFIADGHTVIGCGRSKSHVAELNEKHACVDSRASFEVVDVCDESAVRAWAAAVHSRFGPVELLINNAAVMNRPARLWEIPAKEFDTLIDVNIKGIANVVRAFVPEMVKQKSGVIVNLSSGWGRSTSPQVAPYCASKFAVEGLTLALAQELPAGMAAVPLNPGVIDTDMLRQCWAEGASSYPKADCWAERAAPFLLNLRASDNGKSLTVH